MATTKKTVNTITPKSPTKAVSKKGTAVAPSASKPIKNPTAPEAWEVEKISLGELKNLRTKADLSDLFSTKGGNPQKIFSTIRYEEELEKLQIELVKLQRYVQNKGLRLAVILEGRDAAGKGGTIRRFTEHLNPRSLRVVALPKPTEEERGQWYFQRYVKQLPNKGEMVFFDRSWYNRAVVEPVNGFCTAKQYEMYMTQVNEFEHMLYEDGIIIVKFWFSISKEEQLRRFESRKQNPLKQWKLSPVDMEAQQKWDTYTKYKEDMFSRTHTSFSPWIIVKANNKQKARLESIRYLLSLVNYDEKNETAFRMHPDPNIISRFHRKALQVDN
jgi:polyphosphate kinase 2